MAKTHIKSWVKLVEAGIAKGRSFPNLNEAEKTNTAELTKLD